MRTHKDFDDLSSASMAELVSDDADPHLTELSAAEKAELDENTFSDGKDKQSNDYPASEVEPEVDESDNDEVLDFEDLHEETDPSASQAEYEDLQEPHEMGLDSSLEYFDPSLLESNEPLASQLDTGDSEPEVAELVEVEDEAILEEDRIELMARGRLEMGEGQKARFSDCGNYGQVCDCAGVALFGSGTDWISLRSSGTIMCDSATFGDSSGDKSKTCRCYDTKWCDANKPSDGLEYKTDSAHRRRSEKGMQGVDGYQRRRWCGWGPRDCLWGDWSEYGSCTASCGGGTTTRTRAPSELQANGGSCTGDKSHTIECNTHACPPER